LLQSKRFHHNIKHPLLKEKWDDILIQKNPLQAEWLHSNWFHQTLKNSHNRALQDKVLQYQGFRPHCLHSKKPHPSVKRHLEKEK
jgi:hypothetical protein